MIPPGISAVTISGPFGYTAKGATPKDMSKELELVFENIEASLRDTRVMEAWKAVYNMTYHRSAARGDALTLFTAF